MIADDLIDTQRALRSQLLEHGSLRWRPARDLAAQMLLYLDDPARCWTVGLNWLQERLDADRVTGGRCDPFRAFYAPDFEAIRPDRPLEPIVGMRVDRTDPMLLQVLSAPRTVVFTAVAEQRLFQPADDALPLQPTTIPVKLGSTLRWNGASVGIVCVHWLEERPRLVNAACPRLTEVTRDVMGPILAAAERISSRSLPGSDTDPPTPVARRHAALLETLLTPAEMRLAQLAATGMTYKEIARHLNRSFSTVDHHLRSIRQKVGVNSAPKLATLLSTELGPRRS